MGAVCYTIGTSQGRAAGHYQRIGSFKEQRLMLRVFRTAEGAVVQQDGNCYDLPNMDWDELFGHTSPAKALRSQVEAAAPGPSLAGRTLLAPLASQEVWAAGVTYYRSRDA